MVGSKLQGQAVVQSNKLVEALQYCEQCLGLKHLLRRQGAVTVSNKL